MKKGTYALSGAKALDAIRTHYEREEGCPAREFTAWKEADPVEDARYIRDLAAAEEIAREDIGLLTVYVTNPEEEVAV